MYNRGEGAERSDPRLARTFSSRAGDAHGPNGF